MTQEIKKTVPIIKEQKSELLKSGKIKLVSPVTNSWVGVTPVSPSTCFVGGSLVLMTDMSWKAIDQIKLGEMMWGIDDPVECIEEYVTRLGNRKMITFDDQSLFWSEEHAFWTRDIMGDQWWWSYNADMWRREVETGVIGGLLNNDSIRTGEIPLEYAHLDGWKLQKSQVAVGNFNENTPLYLPMTDGSPIVVNGYLVAAGVNEKNFDYTSIKWTAVSTYRETNLLEEF